MALIALLLAHKQMIVAGIAAVAIVGYTFAPSIGQAIAAPGGNPSAPPDHSAAGGQPTNPNAYKVCAFNDTPQKCYGHTAPAP
jgi:hypothetical protein